MCEIEKGVLSNLFESRESNLYVLTEKDKKQIENLTKDNDTYEKLFNIIEELSDDTRKLDKVRDGLDRYIDRTNIVGSYENEKFYKIRIVRCNKFDIECVYGLDYCASEETYTKIKTKIKDGVEAIHGVEFSETKELGRVNKVDPLGITYLRVRGMWGMENPWTVFKYAYEKNLEKEFNFFAIINEEKYADFSKEDRKEFEDFVSNSDLTMTKIKIKNPDNPAILNGAYIITYSK